MTRLPTWTHRPQLIVAAPHWDMVKTAIDGWGNGGAASNETIAADGYMQVTAGPLGIDRMIGLSYVDADANYTSIEFAVYFQENGNLQVVLAGVMLGTATGYAAGDVFRVRRSGVTMTCHKQTGGVGAFALVYTWLVDADSDPMLVDAAIYQNAAQFNEIRLFDVAADGRPRELAGTWQGVTGVAVLD